MQHSLTLCIWIKWDVFSTWFCFLLRITCWQPWQMSSNSHIPWCLQPEHTPNVSTVSDTHVSLSNRHSSKSRALGPLTPCWNPPSLTKCFRGDTHASFFTEGIKVVWKAESSRLLKLYSGISESFKTWMNNAEHRHADETQVQVNFIRD